MANTTNDHYAGDLVRLEIALTGNRSTKPASGDYYLIGACKSKSFKMTATTVDGTTDATVGGFTSSFVVGGEYEISLEGLVRANDLAGERYRAVKKLFLDAINNKTQPTVWTRKTDANDDAVTAFCIVSDMSDEAPTRDLCSFSIALKTTESAFGVEMTEA